MTEANQPANTIDYVISSPHRAVTFSAKTVQPVSLPSIPIVRQYDIPFMPHYPGDPILPRVNLQPSIMSLMPLIDLHHLLIQ